MREVQRDIDGTCDAVAAPLAELFSFLGSHALLRCRLLAARLTSFCSNMRTSETSQAQAAARPAADRVEVPERTPDVKPLSLMQTVIMFFARGLAFGKPEFRLVTPMSIFSCPDRTKSYRTIWPSRPSESCPKGWPGAPPQVERSTFTSSVVANARHHVTTCQPRRTPQLSLHAGHASTTSMASCNKQIQHLQVGQYGTFTNPDMPPRLLQPPHRLTTLHCNLRMSDAIQPQIGASLCGVHQHLQVFAGKVAGSL